MTGFRICSLGVMERTLQPIWLPGHWASFKHPGALSRAVNQMETTELFAKVEKGKSKISCSRPASQAGLIKRGPQYGCYKCCCPILGPLRLGLNFRVINLMVWVALGGSKDKDTFWTLERAHPAFLVFSPIKEQSRVLLHSFSFSVPA